MSLIKAAGIVAVSAALAIAQVKPVSSLKDLKYPALHDVNVPKPTRFELPNGTVVFLLEDHELPTIEMEALVRTGGRLVPAEKAGLASMTGSVMRTGGTATHKGDDLDNLLDHMGASIESAIATESGTVRLSGLKEDFDKLLPLFIDVIRNPVFPQDKIELAKTRARDAIARRNDDPFTILQRELPRTLYGKDSPYARRPEYDTINSITRDDLVAFHKRYYQPENVILGVWGDFKLPDMRARIEKEFGAWPKGGQPKPPVPEVDAAARNRKGIFVVNKEDVNQSLLAVGASGGRMSDPDYAANMLMAAILGGGEFGSRLMDNIRTKAGLAYMSGAFWGASYDHPGVYLAYVGTKSNTTMQALKLVKEELNRAAAGEVTDKELAFAKDYILKGQAFDFDSTGKIITRLMTYEYYGYPSDFLQKYTEAVKKATKADLQRAAKQYWTADKLSILLLGKTADFDQPVSTLGDVQMIDITIPKPKEAQTAPATSQTLTAGKDLLARVRQAYGGDKLASVKDYVGKADMSMVTPQGEFAMKTEHTVTTSGKSLQKMTTPMGEIVQGFDGKVVWMKNPQGVQEMPQAAAAAREQAFRETLSLLSSQDVKAQALGKTQFNGKEAEGLLVTDGSGKMQVKLLVDPKTGMLLGKTYSGMTMGGPGETEEVYLDYTDVNGIKFPAHFLVTVNGKKVAEVKVSAYQVNTGAADSVFAKP